MILAGGFKPGRISYLTIKKKRRNFGIGIEETKKEKVNFWVVNINLQKKWILKKKSDILHSMTLMVCNRQKRVCRNIPQCAGAVWHGSLYSACGDLGTRHPSCGSHNADPIVLHPVAHRVFGSLRKCIGTGWARTRYSFDCRLIVESSRTAAPDRRRRSCLARKSDMPSGDGRDTYHPKTSCKVDGILAITTHLTGLGYMRYNDRPWDTRHDNNRRLRDRWLIMSLKI